MCDARCDELQVAAGGWRDAMQCSEAYCPAVEAPLGPPRPPFLLGLAAAVLDALRPLPCGLDSAPRLDGGAAAAAELLVEAERIGRLWGVDGAVTSSAVSMSTSSSTSPVSVRLAKRLVDRGGVAALSEPAGADPFGFLLTCSVSEVCLLTRFFVCVGGAVAAAAAGVAARAETVVERAMTEAAAFLF